MGRFSRWAPYVPVAKRRKNAEKKAQRLAQKGTVLNPLRITGRTIASTFWGKAWCDNLEKYCDEYNRMPRGRTYARNGSVVDLQISKGKVTGLVSGSSLYKISIVIESLSAKAWQKLCQDCSQEAVSLLDLMRGKLSDTVLNRLTDPTDGLFPKKKEIRVTCSCPDSARMCKHVAAVLYGVGHRLDSSPELFFQLRGVDQTELVSQALALQNSSDVMGLDQSSDFASEDLGSIFGIDLAVAVPESDSPAPPKARARRSNKTKGTAASIASTVLTKRPARKKKDATSKRVDDGVSILPPVKTRKKPAAKVASKTAPTVAASQDTDEVQSSKAEANAVLAKRKTVAAPARKKRAARATATKR